MSLRAEPHPGTTALIVNALRTEGAVSATKLQPGAQATLLKEIGRGGFSLHEVAEAKALAEQSKGGPLGQIIAGLAEQVLGAYEQQQGWRKLLANLRDPSREVRPSTEWQRHLPGVPSAAIVQSWRGTINDNIHTLAATVNKGELHRGFHAGTVFAEPGQLKIYKNAPIPEGARVGFLAPRADGSAPQHQVAVRGSNGQGCPFLAHSAGDVRGLAVQGEGFTVTATNQTHGQHVDQANGFISFAKAITRATAAGLSGLLNQGRSAYEVTKEFGLEAPSVLARLTRDTTIPPDSLATESFVGSVVRLGEYTAKVVWVPAAGVVPGTQGGVNKHDPQYLSKDADARGEKKWMMCLQFYTNEQDTPLDDATKAWKSPRIPVGELVTKPAADAATRAAERAIIDQMRFNPGDFDAGPPTQSGYSGVLPDAMGNVRQALYDESANVRKADSTEVSRQKIAQFDLSGR